MDYRTPIAKARDEWLESEEGIRCCGSGFLRHVDDARYLQNRLELAFMAGIQAEKRTTFDLVDYIEIQREWSGVVFGEGRRTAGLIEHIRLELGEIEDAPEDVMEWVDVIILALDGAWRTGCAPAEIARAMAQKQVTNIQRKWPESSREGEAIEHIAEEGGAS